jgi:hypothetical protein
MPIFSEPIYIALSFNIALPCLKYNEYEHRYLFKISCEKIYGGHLAEIADAKENNFLLKEVAALGGIYPFQFSC